MARARGYVSIGQRINALIIISLIFGIGLITLFLSTRLIDSSQKSIDDLISTNSRYIYATIETIMMDGRASLAEDYFRRIENDSAGLNIKLYRTNGEEAFIDNDTIREVNELLAVQPPTFEERFEPGRPPVFDSALPGENELFAQAAQSGFGTQARAVWIEDRLVKQAFSPLLNLPKCTRCHGTGSDSTVRGVLDIRFDITDQSMEQQLTIGLSSSFFIFLVLLLAVFMGRTMRSIIVKPVQSIAAVCREVTRGNFEPRIEVIRQDEIGDLSGTVNSMIRGLEERFKLGKYVSGETLKALTASEKGSSQNMVVFFADIRGFTKYSSGTDPETTVAVLNDLLNIQSEVIHRFGGDVDKFVGDEVMAVFSGQEAGLRALCAAVSIQAQVNGDQKRFNNLQLGIGINEGPVIQGMIGSESRADFTVIGDTVNTASRFCSAAGKGETIGAYEMVKSIDPNRLQEELRLEGPFKLVVKGKGEALRVYKIWEK